MPRRSTNSNEEKRFIGYLKTYQEKTPLRSASLVTGATSTNSGKANLSSAAKKEKGTSGTTGPGTGAQSGKKPSQKTQSGSKKK